VPRLGQLPGGFRPGHATADDVDVVHLSGLSRKSRKSRKPRHVAIKSDKARRFGGRNEVLDRTRI